VTSAVRPRWEFADAADWITAIDEVENNLVFAGSRDGSLYVLNKLGALLSSLHCGSWVGAVKAIKLDTSWCKPAIYLLLGTKRGTISCWRLQEEGRDIRPARIYTLQIGNTVREIDVIERDSDVWIVAGSEDRRVYRLNLRDVIKYERNPQHDVTVRQVRLNGWIRSVAFAFDSASDRPMVAAGCGDRNLYLLSENDFDGGDAAKPTEVAMDGKVTSILADPAGSAIFCGSDAKHLAVVNRSGSGYEVHHRTEIPSRVVRLSFEGSSFFKILIGCEDGSIYQYDVARRRLSGYIPVPEPVLALRCSSVGRLLLGYATGRLDCCGYRPVDVPSATTSTIPGDLAVLPDEDVKLYSETLLAGPKGQSIDIGIGRFIHLTPELDGAPRTCVVGTDEGDVVVINLSEEGVSVLHRVALAPARVWCVDSSWCRPALLRVAAATSDDEVIELEIDLSASPVTDRRESWVKVEDWPREIRRVDGADACLFVCCEDGTILLVGSAQDPIATGLTLRTGVARLSPDGYEMLIGSDEGYVKRLAGEEIVWEHKTLDRVREVLMRDGECMAVSEDRFLYVWDESGALRWSYRFPNRALCVDVVVDEKGSRYFVVGCGDGYVYVLDVDGAITASYEFQDRIRDVAVLGPSELLVACENGRLYRVPTLDAFVVAHRGRHVEELVNALEEPDTRLLPVERLALLAEIDQWSMASNAELTSLLLEATESDVLAKRSPHWSQIFAHALVRFALMVDLEAGRARIEAFLKAARFDAHAQYAVLRSMPRSDASPSWRPIADTVVVHVPLEDDWIRGQLLDQVERHGLFLLSGNGFRLWFNHIPIRFGKLAVIVDAAATSERPVIRESPLVALIAFLHAPEADRAKFLTLSELVGDEDVMVVRCMRTLEDLLFGLPVGTQVSLDWVSQGIGDECEGLDAISVVEDLVKRFGAANDDTGRSYGLLADLISERILRLGFKVSASQFLMIQFICGWVRAIGVRHAERRTL
jgi:WD40 repeat protein